MPKIPDDPRIPVAGRNKTNGRNGHIGHVGRFQEGSPDTSDTLDGLDASQEGNLIQRIETYLAKYLVLDSQEKLVVATWIVSAWLIRRVDRFPHLAIWSPVKRCGKTRLLQVIQHIVPNPQQTSNLTIPIIFRLVENSDPLPCFLIDESQSLQRLGSENSEVLRELLNSSIDSDAKAMRCYGKNHDIKSFSLYSPEVIAAIGKPDGILMDRCLPIAIKRKAESDRVTPYRSRRVKEVALLIKNEIEEWTESNADEFETLYDTLEYLKSRENRLFPHE